MKKRRTIIISFVLAAVLVIGVGFASLTDTLTVQGTADVLKNAANVDFEKKVYFSKAELGNATTDSLVLSDQTYTNAAHISTDDPDMASFSAQTLTVKDTYAEFIFTIKNESDLAVLVTPNLSVNNTTGVSGTNYDASIFTVTSDWNSQPQTVAAGGTKTITITVTLNETPQENVSGQFTIVLTANSVSNSN